MKLIYKYCKLIGSFLALLYAKISIYFFSRLALHPREALSIGSEEKKKEKEESQNIDQKVGWIVEHMHCVDKVI